MHLQENTLFDLGVKVTQNFPGCEQIDIFPIFSNKWSSAEITNMLVRMEIG